MKQSDAIALKPREPFVMAGLWEEYSAETTGERIRTFAGILRYGEGTKMAVPFGNTPPSRMAVARLAQSPIGS
ncbi:hypothetical protein [Mesorhizobium sp. 128a]